MKPKHTENMPWDNLWDYKYYKISKVRMRMFKVKLMPIKKSPNA
uniref:Uncharacterized protein n=1 Tax=viral metagenome TaxID=1070528 RepID=A0A6M3LS36_9ZZZZ